MAYRELVLPQKVRFDEKTLTDSYGKFIAEPYERGYGHTVGNALRRVLLSSTEGAAVTAVRIEGARHEYSSLPGIREDAINILLNLKKLRIKLFSNGPEMIYLSAKKEGPVKAGKIQPNANVEVVNKDLVIANVELGGKLEMEIEVCKGSGYMSAEDLAKQSQWPAGFLPLDAGFSPVTRVRYDVEDARVGQVTDYDQLILEIWTDGTVHPRDALAYSAKLLGDSLASFAPEGEAVVEPQVPAYSAEAEALGGGVGAPGETGSVALDSKLRDLLNQPVDLIELSSRASNCLKVAQIKTVQELVRKREEELLAVKNFGKKSLNEIKERLKDMGFSLGMQV